MDEIDEVRFTVRLPKDADRFLEAAARNEFTSKNAQVVRAVRAAMKRTHTSPGVGLEAARADIG